MIIHHTPSVAYVLFFAGAALPLQVLMCTMKHAPQNTFLQNRQVRDAIVVHLAPTSRLHSRLATLASVKSVQRTALSVTSRLICDWINFIGYCADFKTPVYFLDCY